jgi:Flp pilus assembly protein TadD
MLEFGTFGLPAIDTAIVTSEKPTLSVSQSMAMAWRHYRMGTREDAVMISLRVLDIEPKNPDALHLLGVMAYEGNKQDEAIELISEAIRVNKKYAPMHGNLALAKLAKGDLNGAAFSARKAFALSPAYADAHRVLGLVYQKKGCFKEAVKEFRRAQGLGLKSAELESNLAIALKQLQTPLATSASKASTVSTT